MAERHHGSHAASLSRAPLHPEYRDVLKTYAKNSGLHVEEIPLRRGWHARSEGAAIRAEGRCWRRSSCNRRISLA